MIVLAIDPGNEQSAWALYDAGAPRLLAFGIEPNDQVRDLIAQHGPGGGFASPNVLAIEMIASYGMAVGREVFDTCVWIGRFIEMWKREAEPEELVELVYRRDVKLHLCGQARAKDANIRAALLDMFGPGKEKAVGTKKSPGPLHGVTADVWSALAVAVTVSASPRPLALVCSEGAP